MKSKRNFNPGSINSKHIGRKIKIDETLMVLIVALIVLIVSMHGKPSETPMMATEKITTKLVGSESQNPVIDETKLDEIRQMDYVQLKEYFNTKKDFCIYIQDENGRIILAKGSPELTKGGLYCNG